MILLVCMDLSHLQVERREFSKGEQFLSYSAACIHSETWSLVRAASLLHWVRRRRRSRRRKDCHMVGYKDGRLYNGELIFHKVASHHQEEEISEIKNEISSAHGQKPCRLWTFSVLPLANLIGSSMIASSISAFSKHQLLHEAAWRQTPHADNTHTHTHAHTHEHQLWCLLSTLHSNNGATRARQRLAHSCFWHVSWDNLRDVKMIYCLFSTHDD